MNDMKELMTSLVTVQAAGIKAGLQAGDAERERLERERDEALELLREFASHYDGREQLLRGVAYSHLMNARAFLAKHGRLPT